MKTITTIFGLLASLSCMAHADAVQGRATLTVWLDMGSTYVTEIRQEGNRILGQTAFGETSIVDLTIGNGSYYGSFGGMTDLKCDDRGCSGLIDSKSAHYRYERLTGNDGSSLLNLNGAMNFAPLRATRNANQIEVKSKGSYTLDKTGDGTYSGVGYLTASPGSRFRAQLETSGSLKDLDDPGLFAVVLGSVVSLSR